MGNMIKLLRKNKGMTQTDVAKTLQISQQAYAKYETGETEADYKSLKKLSQIYNVSIDYLLGNVSNNNIVAREPMPIEDAKNLWLDTLAPIERNLIVLILNLSTPLQYQAQGYISRLAE